MSKRTSSLYDLEREFDKRYGERLKKLDIKLDKHRVSVWGTCDIAYTFGKSWGSALSGGKCFEVPIYRVTSLFGKTLCKHSAEHAKYTVRDEDSIFIRGKKLNAYNSYVTVRGMTNLIKYIKVLRKTIGLKQAALKIRTDCASEI